MKADEWSQRVVEAALDLSRAAPAGGFAGSVSEWVGHLLIVTGRAAGHADQMAGSGTAADRARDHFRREMNEAGALALGLLQESRRRQGRPRQGNDEVTAEIARRRVVAGKATGAQGYSIAAGHASAALGAAIAAVGRAIQTIPLDDEHLPELDAALESTVAHAIAAVARS